jgi:hypothetical protein
MKFPTLSFELDIIKNFLSSESKFSWFIQQFKMEFNGETQLAIIFMIGFALFSLFIVWDAERYSNYLPGKSKRLIIRILFFPPNSIITYYFGKLILYWFLWVVTLGWWSIPVILGSGILFAIIVILISKHIDKDN